MEVPKTIYEVFMPKKQSEADLMKPLGLTTRLRKYGEKKYKSTDNLSNQQNPECDKLHNKWPSLINGCIAREKKKKQEEL